MEYKIKDEDALVVEYNEISARHLKLNHHLKDLTDYELFVWITGRTYRYG